MAGITVKIGGCDMTEYVDARTLSIKDELTSKVNSASFDFICNNIAVAPKPGRAVLIEEGTKKLFSGRILSIKESFLPPNLLKYPVECIDHTRDLDKKLVYQMHYQNQKAGNIIKFIILYYTTGFTYNNVSDGPKISDISFDYMQVSDVFTKIAEICGYEWYVDYEKDVHFFDSSLNPAPFQLDDDQANYKDLILNKDISQLRNRVYVKSSAIKDTFGEVFIGDGLATSWTCKFAPIYKERIKLPDINLNLRIEQGAWNTDFSHNDIYLAMAYERFLGRGKGIILLKRSGDDFAKINDPDVTPNADGHDVTFSSNSTYLAVVSDVSPYVMIYKRDEDTFTKLTNPAILPTGTGWGCDFSRDDIYLAIAHATTPFITIYKRAGDAFTKLDNPVDLPPDTGIGVEFSPSGDYLVVTHDTTPFITIYKRAGDVFTKLDNPVSLPTGSGNMATWTSDSLYLAIGHNVSPYITVYKRAGDAFTKLDNPVDLPTGTCCGVDWSPDGINLAVAHENTPFVTIYTRSGDVLNKQDDPIDLPAGTAKGATYSHDGKYLVISGFDRPQLTIYKQFAPTIKVDGVTKTIGWDGIDNPDYYDYMLNGTTKVLSLGTETGTPADGVELILGYTVAGISICFRRDDMDSIADRIEKEGGDGIIEFCIVDNNINSLDWANEVAKSDLLQNAYPVIKATFITNRSDIRSGQIININSTKRDINQQFIVQSIELIRVDVLKYGIAEIPYKLATEAVIGYKPADEAKIPYKPVDTEEIIYYVFNVTIANKFKKLEDLFVHLLTRTDESLK